MNDFCFALRQLRKSPGFTFIAVLTLSLGIGANTAIFSVINSVLLESLPYPDAGRIVVLQEKDNTGSGEPYSMALPDYLDWRHDATVFQDFALTHPETSALSDIPGRAPEQIPVAFVTENFFRLIGVGPEMGRTFSRDEDKAGAPFVTVLSDKMWTQVFARDPNILGRKINFGGRLATVIGVMPPAVDAPSQPDAWFSMMRRADNDAWPKREIHPMLFGWARLKPGLTIEEARAQITAIAARLEKTYPETNKNVGSVVTPLLESLVGKYRTNLALLLGAVGLVLLIACANLANLFAARGVARAREFAIRAAVGATRLQLVRQLLIESLVIALLGGIVGFIFALWSRDLVEWLAPNVARFQTVHFDARVLAFTFLLTGLTTILFGLWPAWQAARADVQLALKSTQNASESKGARRLRDWLVIADVALTLVLLSSAGVVLKSFARLQALSLGFEPRGLTTARIDLPWRNYRDAKALNNFTAAVMEKVRALPGVEKVAFASNPPLLTPWHIGFAIEGKPVPPPSEQDDAESEAVSGDYLGALGATLLRGRAFDVHDTKDSPRVTMIDQALADKFFRGQNPIGKRLTCNPDGNDTRYYWYEIVGVVATMKRQGAEPTAASPLIHFPLAQVYRNTLTLLVRSDAKAGALEKPIRDIVASVDHRQPVYDVRSMSDRVAQTWATQRLLTNLLAVFAGLALVLATVGLYGVLAYNAARRLREIALRVALGASRGQIRGFIFNHGLRLLLIGCAVGLAGAVLSVTMLGTVVTASSPNEPAIYLFVAAILALATAIACWFPAQRALRVDPITVLRTE
ncbi:MAG TPA: ABC transporter permease [Chthoniobacterales bacterium]|jgi:putative ABC transport system permease protein